MNWSVGDIETRFLNGKLDSLALSPEAVVSAFDGVEKMLGSGWIANETSGKGLAPTMSA